MIIKIPLLSYRCNSCREIFALSPSLILFLPSSLMALHHLPTAGSASPIAIRSIRQAFFPGEQLQ